MEMIGAIAILLIPLIGVAVSCLVLTFGIVNYRLAIDSRGLVILKTLFVLAIWAGASAIMIFMLFANFMAASHPINPEVADSGLSKAFIILVLIYIAIGGALVFWMKRNVKDENT